ncbi:unnamed protein product [Lampetra planeri]
MRNLRLESNSDFAGFVAAVRSPLHHRSNALVNGAASDYVARSAAYGAKEVQRTGIDTIGQAPEAQGPRDSRVWHSVSSVNQREPRSACDVAQRLCGPPF